MNTCSDAVIVCESDGSLALGLMSLDVGLRCEGVVTSAEVHRMQDVRMRRAQSARATYHIVHRWSRTEGAKAAVFASCERTLRQSVVKRAREWSDHVHMVVASPELQQAAVAGAC